MWSVRKLDGFEMRTYIHSYTQQIPTHMWSVRNSKSHTTVRKVTPHVGTGSHGRHFRDSVSGTREQRARTIAASPSCRHRRLPPFKEKRDGGGLCGGGPSKVRVALQVSIQGGHGNSYSESARSINTQDQAHSLYSPLLSIKSTQIRYLP
jgi:hypothetical protein